MVVEKEKKPLGRRRGDRKMYLWDGVGGGFQERTTGGHRSSVAGKEEASLKGVEDGLVGEEERERRAKARRR